MTGADLTLKKVHLKAYRCPDGREIHYAAARLRRDPADPGAETRVLDVCGGDVEAGAPPTARHCIVFFYPMGPNRRLLDAVVARVVPRFDGGGGDVLFLCANRPGKGGTSSAPAAPDGDTDERQHVRTAVADIISILDHHGVARASLLYMCAGSTFAFAFAAAFPARATGHILGISSWILRSEPAPSGGDASAVSDQWREEAEIRTPQIHSWTHRMAMRGTFGPRWLVSHLAGSITGCMPAIWSRLPPLWVGSQFKKQLSPAEVVEFDKEYPDGEKFVATMRWISEDGRDPAESVFVNGDNDGATTACWGVPRGAGAGRGEGDARDVAVCLSTQQDLGLVYRWALPEQRQVRLWHGRDDGMVSVRGAWYLEAALPNATLTEIPQGTHQGIMFFFPDDVTEAINRIVILDSM